MFFYRKFRTFIFIEDFFCSSTFSSLPRFWDLVGCREWFFFLSICAAFSSCFTLFCISCNNSASSSKINVKARNEKKISRKLTQLKIWRKTSNEPKANGIDSSVSYSKFATFIKNSLKILKWLPEAFTTVPEKILSKLRSQ